MKLEQLSPIVSAGLMDLAVGLQLALLAIDKEDEEKDFITQTSGDLNRELRDLAHHVIHKIPDPGVDTWLKEGSPEELAGVNKLVASAKKYGYRDDDLATVN